MYLCHGISDTVVVIKYFIYSLQTKSWLSDNTDMILGLINLYNFFQVHFFALILKLLQESPNLFQWKSHGSVNVSSFLRVRKSSIQADVFVMFALKNTEQGCMRCMRKFNNLNQKKHSFKTAFCMYFIYFTYSLNISLPYWPKHWSIKLLVAISVTC